MFDKQQRFVLNKLSASIWNVDSRWQKMYNAGHFDITESETEVDESVTQLCVSNSKRTRGTIVNKVTAMNKKLWKDTPETIKVKRRTMRKPSYDELLKTLTDLSKAVVFSKMNNTQLINALAIDFVAKDEAVNAKLVRKEDEGYLKDYSDLFQRLDVEVQAKVMKLEENTQGIPVDALEFVSELLFAKTHYNEALELYNGNIEQALVAHKRDLRKQAYKARAGLQ